MLALERRAQARSTGCGRPGGSIQLPGAPPVRCPWHPAGSARSCYSAQEWPGHGELRRRRRVDSTDLREVCSRRARGAAGKSSALARASARTTRELAAVRLVFRCAASARERGPFSATRRRACRPILDRSAADSGASGPGEWSRCDGQGLAARYSRSADRRRPCGDSCQARARLVLVVACCHGWAFAFPLRGAFSRAGRAVPDGLRLAVPFAPRLPVARGDRSFPLRRAFSVWL